MESRIVSGQEVVEWVADQIAAAIGDRADYGPAVGIGVERGHKIIGGVIYNEWNGSNINIHTAGLPGSGWLSRWYLWCVFDYPFRQIAAKRVTTAHMKKNVPSSRLAEKLGFKLEHTIKDYYPNDDMVIYGLYKDDCSWLNRGPTHGKEIAITATAA